MFEFPILKTGLLYHAAGYIQGEMQFFAVAILESFPDSRFNFSCTKAVTASKTIRQHFFFFFPQRSFKNESLQSLHLQPSTFLSSHKVLPRGGEDDAVLISSKQDTNSLFSSPAVNTINRMNNVAWRWGIIMKQATWFAEFCFIFSSVLPLGCSSNFRVS